VSLYDKIAQNVAGGTLRAAGLAKMAIKLAEGSGTRKQWTYEPDEPYPDVVRHASAATQPYARTRLPTAHCLVHRWKWL
jgi:hypothetical protein